MATEKEKKAAQEARDAISSTVSRATEDDEKPIETKQDNQEEQKAEVVIETNEEVKASEEKIEALEEEAEDENLTKEERAKLERRIQKEREKNKGLREQLEATQRELANKSSEGTLTEEDVERRANAKVAEKNFESAVKKLVDEASKIDAKFADKINEVVEDLGGLERGGIPPVMIDALSGLDKGGDVLAYLANHPDDYEEIRSLSVGRMAVRLKKIEDTLAEERKTPIKKISKVPDPIKPLDGKGQTPGVLRDDEPIDDWVKKRNQQAEEHRRGKLRLN